MPGSETKHKKDLAAVGVPVTGAIYFAPYGTPVPAKTELVKADAKFDDKFQEIGLLTEDGGPKWVLEPDGDPLEFWQDGYQIPSGLAKVELTFGAAQTDKVVEEFKRGSKYDATGYRIVDGGGNPNQYVVCVDEVFKNGVIRRRVGQAVTVVKVKDAESKRGEVYGSEITVSFARNEGHPGGHFHEALIQPPSAPGVGG